MWIKQRRLVVTYLILMQAEFWHENEKVLKKERNKPGHSLTVKSPLFVIYLLHIMGFKAIYSDFIKTNFLQVSMLPVKPVSIPEF